MSQLSITSVYCHHAKQLIIDNLSMQLDAGDIGCFLGASGSGKTTLLRSLAGFHRQTQGEIRLGQRLLQQGRHSMPAHLRQIGLVFQDYALFPHLNLTDNIGFGVAKKLRGQRVEQLLDMIGLTAYAKAYPHQLSGGQQQRVALARAMAPQPELLLLDEPFSNLDVELREQLGRDIRHWLKAENITAILVTHDQHEAFVMADKVGVLHQGKLQQWDSPYNLYHQPVNPYVADFVGEGVFISAILSATGSLQTELGYLDLPLSASFAAGTRLELLLRPDDILHDDASPLKARVIDKAFRGAEFLYRLQLPSGQPLLSLVPSHHNHALGEDIGIRLDISHGIIFEPR